MERAVILFIIMFIVNFNARALSIVERSYDEQLFRIEMYEKMDGKWLTNDYITFETAELIKEIRNSYYEGMNQNKYIDKIPNEIVRKVAFGDILSDVNEQFNEKVINIIITDAFIEYTKDIFLGVSFGRLKDKDNLIKRTKKSYYDEMRKLNKNSEIYFKPTQIIATLKPKIKMYNEMIDLYKKIDRIEKNGTWEQVQVGIKIAPMSTSPAIAVIRRNLSLLYGDIDYEDEETYDVVLIDYVKQFQRMAGIASTGMIGAATIKEMNKGLGVRKNTLAVNMERLRTLHTIFPETYIIVNIPMYEFQLYAENKIVMRMKAVVGKKDRKTPVLENSMKYMVVNPTWTIPKTILEKDVIPARIKDIEYFQKNNIKIFRDDSGKKVEINQSDIDWGKGESGRFNELKFVQDSNEKNALGKVKFILNNKENIYLHDTQAKSLFQNTDRAFSSGCVRLEKAVKLAEYLMQTGKGNQTVWFRKIMEKKKDYYVGLPKPMTVYIYYLTAYLNKENEIVFLKDVYEKDNAIYSILSEK